MKMTPRALTLTTMIFLAALSRLVPHPWNFAPITGMALFAGSYFQDKRWAFGVPFIALLISDLFIGFYSTMWATYLAFAVIVGLGFWLANGRTFSRIAFATLSGSLLFFLITNFAVWLFSGLYPRTPLGFIECYALAIPFFQNTVLGDIFYTSILFGSFRTIERMVPALNPA
jgi:hypothetical protein